ncbi:polymer-forming cytoskeletal protein [Lysinibacillus sp. NPDC047702]|uniref:polymer-forming cytoskeletal protein n=1 Tax=unclassified Lysinibacillus TaxID=2636778 RepID=UPI003D02263F
MRNRNYFNERGYTFIIALLLIVLISVLGFSLITITSNTLKVTTHERADQSVFYIAEADLNVKRAEINQELESVLIPILNKYNNDENFDMDKDRNKIDEEYIEAADFYLTEQLKLEDEDTHKKYKKYHEVTSYEKQNGLQPSSQVTLIKENQQYTYTLRSIAEIDGISRTISQTFTIKTPSFTKKDSEDEETPPTTNYNFCYGILTNSFETKNTLNTDADIVSLNDLIIDNTGTFENIYVRGNLTIKNTAKVNGEILAFGDITFENGGDYNNVYSKGKIRFTKTPTINGNLVALSDIIFENGGTYNKDIISNGGISFKTTNGAFYSSGNIFSVNDILIEKRITPISLYSNKNIIVKSDTDIKGVVFGKESIKTSSDKEWANGLGKKRYSMGEIVYRRGDNMTNIRAKNEEEFNQFLVKENINLNNYYNQINNLKKAQGASSNSNDCGSQSLSNSQIPQAPPFLSIDNSSFIEIPDIALSWNTPDTLSLTDNSYIKNMSLVENRTLTIDVGDKDRTLVIDNLNGGGGHIKVQGTGKLNILVKNKFNILQFISSAERSPFDTTIYYEGSDELNITKTIQSNLYTKNSKVNIQNAGEGGLQGNMIIGGSQGLTVSGNTTFGNTNDHVVIFVPNASLNFTGSSTIFGTIIGNKVDAVGSNTTHKFDKNKINFDLFSQSQKSEYIIDGGLIDPEVQKEI